MTYTVESTLLHAARTRLVKDYGEQIRVCLRALSEDQIWWRPNEKANAIGNLVVHLCGSTRFHIAHGVGGLDFVRDRAAEFTPSARMSRDELIGRLTEVMTECDGVLAALDPVRLTDTTERTGKTSTYAQIILHVMLHFAVHTGQIVYATKMLQEGAIDELWMKMRAR